MALKALEQQQDDEWKRQQDQIKDAFEKEANKWPPAGGPKDRPPQKQPGIFANLDEAMDDAQPGDVFRATEACKWIAKQKVDDARRANVIDRLEPLLAEVFIRDEAARTIGKWASKDQVPLLITMLDNQSGAVKKVGFDNLARLKDDRAAEPLARKLTDFPERGNAAIALLAFGPTAEKEVAKYAFDPDNGVQSEARKVLKGYKTKDAVYVAQAIDDLTTGDNNRKQHAAAWLEKAPVDAKLQEGVAKALDPLVADNDRGVRDSALKAIKTWASRENTSSLVNLLADQDVNVRKLAIETLGKLKDERAIVPIGIRLSDGADRQTASLILRTMGPMVEIPEVIGGLGNQDAAVRLEICRILAAVGSSKSVPSLQRIAKVDKNKDVQIAATLAVKVIEEREKEKDKDKDKK
jgi:HEAT repeat protein